MSHLVNADVLVVYYAEVAPETADTSVTIQSQQWVASFSQLKIIRIIANNKIILFMTHKYYLI